MTANRHIIGLRSARIRMLRSAVVVGCLTASSLPIAASAQMLGMEPLGTHKYIRDSANMINAKDEKRIRETCISLRDDTGVRIAVITVESMGTYTDRKMPIEYFGMLLYQQVALADEKLEGSEWRKGAILLVSKEGNLVHIEMGPAWGRDGFFRGLRIKEEEILPHFDRDHASEGIVAGIDGLDDIVRNFKEPWNSTIPWRVILQVLVPATLTLFVGLFAWSRFPQTSTLHKLARDGKHEALEKRLRKGANANAKDAEGATPLYYGARQGHLRIVERLLAYNAIIDAAPYEGDTPLFQAIQRGHGATTKLLLERGANPKIPLKNGHTHLMQAAIGGSREIVVSLLLHGAATDKQDIDGKTALFFAIERENDEVVEVLLKHGDDVVDHRSKEKVTPLLLALESKRLSMMEILLEEGADPNAGTPHGTTPLIEAILLGKTEAAKLLLRAGAHADAKFAITRRTLGALGKDKAAEGDLMTPLELANKMGQEGLETVLKENESQGVTNVRIFKYVMDGKYNRVRDIVDAAPLSINLKTSKSGWTPLHLAVKSRNLNTVKLLLEKGANVNALANEGETAISEAMRCGDIAIVKLLLDSGADVSSTTDSSMASSNDRKAETRTNQQK